jgi:hypothetical protein
VDTAIEVRNGTPTPHLAQKTRTLLHQKAFTVAKIGNHVNFGAAKTMIYYRPEAQRVAQALQTDIFPMAGMEQTSSLHDTMTIKVLLGRDLLENQNLMARLNGYEVQPPTANYQEPQPLPQNKAWLQQPLTLPDLAPVAQASPPQAPEPLTTSDQKNTAIEIRNGTPTPHLAQKTRTLLHQKGFSVARIGNHIDFGAAQTIIYYRPEAEKVARDLVKTFFPKAELQPNLRLHRDIAVKIILGADFLERPQLMAQLAAERE